MRDRGKVSLSTTHLDQQLLLLPKTLTHLIYPFKTGKGIVWVPQIWESGFQGYKTQSLELSLWDLSQVFPPTLYNLESS